MWFALSVGAALAAALKVVLTKPLAEQYRTQRSIHVAWSMGLAELIPLLAIAEAVALTSGDRSAGIGQMNRPGIFWLCATAQMFLIWPGQLFMNYWRLERNGLTWFFPMNGLLPVIGGVMGYVVLDQRLSPLAWVAIGLIVLSSIIVAYRPGQAHGQSALGWAVSLIYALITVGSGLLVQVMTSASNLASTLTVEAIGPVIGYAIMIWWRRDYHWVPLRIIWPVALADAIGTVLGVAALSLGSLAAVTAVLRLNLAFGYIIALLLPVPTSAGTSSNRQAQFNQLHHTAAAMIVLAAVALPLL